MSAVTGFEPFLSFWKAIPFVVILFLWAKAMAWADKDAIRAHLPRETINLASLATLIVATALFFLLPNFFLATFVFLLLCVANVGTYLLIRKNAVGLHDLKNEFAEYRRNLGRKKGESEVRTGVQLIAADGKPVVPPSDPTTPEAAEYDAAQTLLAEPLGRRAEVIEVAPRGSATRVIYTVDGTPYEGQTLSVETAQQVVPYLKRLAGMDVEDKRRPQKGKMKVKVVDASHSLVVHTAGSTIGESIRIDVDPDKRHAFEATSLGLLPDQLETLDRSAEDRKGIILVCAPQGHGQTSMLYALMRRHDAFLLHMQTIERKPAADLEGITQNTFDPKNPDDAAGKLRWVASQEPEIVMVSEGEAPGLAKEATRVAASGRMVYVGLRVASTAEALLRWRKLMGSEKDPCGQVRAIVVGRVLRRLCEACKIEYRPDPAALKKMNLGVDRVKSLFQPRTEPLRDNKGNPVICDFCGGLGFKGRLGVFEVFEMTDEARDAAHQVMDVAGKQLRPVFRKQHHLYLQEAAFARVEAGQTSVQEVVRVMKPSEKSR